MVNMLKARTGVSNLREVRLVASHVSVESLPDSVLGARGAQSKPSCVDALVAAYADGATLFVVRTAWRANLRYEYTSSGEISAEVEAQLDEQMNDILALRSVGRDNTQQAVTGDGVYLAQIIERVPTPKQWRTYNCMKQEEYVAVGENLAWEGLSVTVKKTAKIGDRMFTTVELHGKEKHLGARTIPDFESVPIESEGYHYSVEPSSASTKGVRLRIGKPTCPPRPNPPTNVMAFASSVHFDTPLELSGGEVAGGVDAKHFVSTKDFPLPSGCVMRLQYVGLIANVSARDDKPRISLELYLVHPDAPFENGSLLGAPPLREYRAVAAADVFLRHTFTWTGRSTPEQLVIRQAEAAPIVETPWYVVPGGSWSLGNNRISATEKLKIVLIGWSDRPGASSTAVQRPIVHLVGDHHC